MQSPTESPERDHLGYQPALDGLRALAVAAVLLYHHGASFAPGGFLGLDNIGVFNRNFHFPGEMQLEQADGTSWMAMYCLNMMVIALELAKENPTYEDIASKFFEHFLDAFVHVAA